MNKTKTSRKRRSLAVVVLTLTLLCGSAGGPTAAMGKTCDRCSLGLL